MLRPQDFEIESLGPCPLPSPLRLSNIVGDGFGNYVPPEARIRYQLDVAPNAPDTEITLEKAGPREQIFFDPKRTTAAIVTCGGLCPGLNNVIRSIYFELCYNYGAKHVLGVRNGYLGVNPDSGLDLVRLTRQAVEEIHKLGGTVLGTSRGPQDPSIVVDTLCREHIDMLFCVGGDGTQRGAHDIAEEVQRRKLPIAIVGIPKTVDNDISFVYRTFGFGTALEHAQEVLRGAHVEAKSTINGVALVKLMGRDAGFIAAGASLASQEVNFCLVPEVRFPLEGPDGLLAALETRLKDRGHALIAVAEGAGQHLFSSDQDQHDDSGNSRPNDIGLFLKDRISSYLKSRQVPFAFKYIDPSYLIRSVPANMGDRLLTDQLARYAVHAAMAGKTDVLMGYWNNAFIHVPIATATTTQKRMEPEGHLWTSVMAATGQPRWPANPQRANP